MSVVLAELISSRGLRRVSALVCCTLLSDSTLGVLAVFERSCRTTFLTSGGGGKILLTNDSKFLDSDAEQFLFNAV